MNQAVLMSVFEQGVPGSMTAPVAGLPKSTSHLRGLLPIAAWVYGVLLLPKGDSLRGHALL